jgi:hypothetical protein
VPPAWAAGREIGDGVVVLDVDSTIVLAHSDKEVAAPTYKHTYGFHPILVTCDNTGELLAVKLRPGNAGANTAADHLEVLAEAVAQIPAAHRRHLLVRGDSAAATHAVLDWLVEQGAKRGRQVEYSIGWAIGEPERTAIAGIPTSGWSPAINADGQIREGAQVAELTGLLELAGWPDGMRVIVRRERPHPSAQLSLFEERDGWRYTAFVTNTQIGALQWLEARHRAHARVEDRIRTSKDTGLRRLPSRDFAINQAWCTAVEIAVDLQLGATVRIPTQQVHHICPLVNGSLLDLSGGPFPVLDQPGLVAVAQVVELHAVQEPPVRRRRPSQAPERSGPAGRPGWAVPRAADRWPYRAGLRHRGGRVHPGRSWRATASGAESARASAAPRTQPAAALSAGPESGGR